MEMYSKTNADFMPAYLTPIPQPIDQGIISTFHSFYFRNTFHKAIAAIGSDSSDGCRQHKLKTL